MMFCAFSVATVFASDGLSADAGTSSAATEAGPVVVADGVLGIPGTVPVSPDAKVHRVTIIGGPDGDTIIEHGTVSGTGTACREDPNAVYCNTLSNTVFGPEAANTPFADDIALASVAGCRMDRYKIRVTGDRKQDGTGLGAYTVDFGLYETCPGASEIPPILGTNTQITIPAETAGDIYEITFVSPYVIYLPNNLYLGVSFSREECGIVLGAPSVLGFSADRFDYPGFSCAAGLGTFPAGPHASFYAEIYVSGDCDRAFAGYKNTNDAGNPWSAGSRVYFADDLMMEVADCSMVALEIGHKGNGFVRVDLHTFLSDSDPGSGGLIPGTRMDCFSSGNNPQICRQEFDPPIPLIAPNPWVVFKSNSGVMGPILTCKHAAPGRTENILMVHRDGAWGLDDTFGEGSACWAGFEVTIYCEGEPPAGACCDMYLTDEASESVCRDSLPEMNCAFPEQWEEGAICESICEDGANDGLPCTRQADCPYGECPGPFAHPGGVAACCKPDGECDNMTENLCYAVPPLEDNRLFQKGQFCYEQGQRCPFPACLQREGECTLARSAWCVGGENDGMLCDYYAFPSECPGYSCVGGTHDGDSCDQDVNCPGGYCNDIGICVGGPQAGNQCNPDAECYGGACERASCVGEVGCEDPYCCTDVCTDPYNVFCCTTYWDNDCATEAFRLCERTPSNDECHNRISEVKGAQLIGVPSTVEGDGIQATTGAADPDFCCYEIPQGSTGPVSSLWYKFVAPPDGRCEGGVRDGQFCDPNAADPNNALDGCPDGICNALEVSVSIDTCCSNPREGGPADDSLLQVYALADGDRGLCSNGLDTCSVAAQDCSDGLPCVYDEEWGCANLMPVACSDDAGSSCVCGPVARPYNSRVCVPGLNPGETYYVQVAAKTSANVGIWQLRVASPCTQSDPPQDNDLCFKPIQLSGQNVEVEFDLLGGALNGPASLDCPEPPPNPLCTSTMKVDLWYDWIAPANGKVTVQTCGFDEFDQPQDELTPDTSLVMYEGCDCPVGMPMEQSEGVLACSDFWPTPCFLGSKLVDIAVEAGTCYKMRVGGGIDNPDGRILAGSLKIDLRPISCPPGPVTFVDPPDGLIDARQPHPTADPNDLQGYDTFIVDAPAGAAQSWAECWSFCDSDDGTENDIANIVDNGDGSFTVTLASPISTGEVSTITYTDDLVTVHRGVFISHPANVNGDSQAAPADILSVIDCLNNVGPPCEIYQCDADRSGICGPPDILRVIDLLNGAGAYDSWLNSSAPVCDPSNCCPD